MRGIAIWWWRVRYWWHFRMATGFPWLFCWAAAVADESYDDDYTPSEAVDSELSYWGDDDGV